MSLKSVWEYETQTQMDINNSSVLFILVHSSINGKAMIFSIVGCASSLNSYCIPRCPRAHILFYETVSQEKCIRVNWDLWSIRHIQQARALLEHSHLLRNPISFIFYLCNNWAQHWWYSARLDIYVMKFCKT